MMPFLEIYVVLFSEVAMDVGSRKQIEKLSKISIFKIIALRIFSKKWFISKRSVVDIFCDPCRFVNCCNKTNLVAEI